MIRIILIPSGELLIVDEPRKHISGVFKTPACMTILGRRRTSTFYRQRTIKDVILCYIHGFRDHKPIRLVQTDKRRFDDY